MGKAVGLKSINPVGQIELRVLFGSFLVALPVYLIWGNQSSLFEFFGIAALAAAIIKTLFTFIDRCPVKEIWVGILVDIILAICLLSSLLIDDSRTF